jgi:hypothetical protein
VEDKKEIMVEEAVVNSESSEETKPMESTEVITPIESESIEERAFIAYYKLGESRTYTKLKPILDKISEGYSLKVLQSWGQKYSWQKRIDEIDKVVKERIDLDLAEENYRAKKDLISIIDSCIEIAKKKIESKQMWVKNIDDVVKLVKAKQDLIGDSPSNDIKIVIERAGRPDRIEHIEDTSATVIEGNDENEVTNGD